MRAVVSFGHRNYACGSPYFAKNGASITDVANDSPAREQNVGSADSVSDRPQHPLEPLGIGLCELLLGSKTTASRDRIQDSLAELYNI